MQVKSITISQFKNLKEVGISFSSRFNCFVGDNGAGKTNIVDALYLLSMTKSFFNSTDAMNIRHGDDFFSVRASYVRNDEPLELLCSYSTSSKKSFKRNGKQYEKLGDHIGFVPLVMVSPEDIDLILGGSEVRRKWLDMVISQCDSEYLFTLMKYNKVLQQRNTLLKSMQGLIACDSSLIEVWDERLVEFGEVILKLRLQFVNEFSPIFDKYYKAVSGGNESVSLAYKESVKSGQLAKSLVDSLGKDAAIGYTSVGIHKDDLSMQLGEYPIRKVGSQGQKKSFIIALKFAMYEWLMQRKGVKPLLLLDDIFDKLDPSRVRAILNIVSSDTFGQVFITDTRRESVETMLATLGADFSIFEIEKGEVKHGNS